MFIVTDLVREQGKTEKIAFNVLDIVWIKQCSPTTLSARLKQVTSPLVIQHNFDDFINSLNELSQKNRVVDDAHYRLLENSENSSLDDLY